MNTEMPASIAQLFDLPETPAVPGKKSTQVIRQEKYDADLFDDTVGASPVMEDLVARGGRFLATFEPLMRDVFIALFKLEPEMLPDDEIADGHLFNKKLMKTLIDSQDFQRLRAMTQLDPLASALGTQILGEKTVRQFESRQQNNDPGEQGGSCSQTGDTSKEISPGNTGKVDSTTGETGPRFPGPDVIDAIAAAGREAVDEVKHVLDKARAWGIEPGNPGLRVSLASKRKALERLRSSPNLHKLADLVGRFRHLARQVFRKRGADGAAAISSVTVGGSLERVLPSEKMMLANKNTRLDFIRRLHQKELLQYKSKSQPAGRGPIIVCCDVSSSMVGRPEEWSKATVLALAEVAQRQKRDFCCILFNSAIVGNWIIPRGSWDPAAIIDMAEVAPSGGTNFKPPLEKALEIINRSRFRKADIVFVTDGHCALDDDFLIKFNQIKQHRGFAVFTVLINIGNHPAAGSVEPFSDEVITLSSLAQLDDSTAHYLFKRIQDRGRPG